MAELLRTHPLQAWSAAFDRLPGTVGITAERDDDGTDQGLEFFRRLGGAGQQPLVGAEPDGPSGADGYPGVGDRRQVDV